MVWAALIQSPLGLAATLALVVRMDMEPLALAAVHHPLKMTLLAR